MPTDFGKPVEPEEWMYSAGLVMSRGCARAGYASTSEAVPFCLSLKRGKTSLSAGRLSTLRCTPFFSISAWTSATSGAVDG